MKEHSYHSELTWTGNKGSGTGSYTSYGREFEAKVENKPVLLGSSDPAFRGDITKYNPEDLLLISLSSCHMLWYLHLCSANGVVITDYEDNASGVMIEDENGGRFKSVTLYPVVTVTEASMQEKANALHHEAHQKCFIANSVNFAVVVEPTARI